MDQAKLNLEYSFLNQVQINLMLAYTIFLRIDLSQT